MAKEKGLKKKHLGAIIGGFAALLVGGVAFAAGTGMLQFQGTAQRGDTVDVDITSWQVNDSAWSTSGVATATDGSTVVVADPENDILTFVAQLSAPGEVDTFSFRVTNTGNAAVVLNELTTLTPPGDGIIVRYPTAMNGLTLAPGAEAGPFIIEVEWDAAFPNSGSEQTFSAFINFAQSQ